MVIQRGNLTWGTSFSSTELHIADDSPAIASESSVPAAESKDTWDNQQRKLSVKPTETKTLVEWKNTFHMRQMTLSNLSTASGQVRQTLSAQAAGNKHRGRYMTSAGKSLDLLRLNIQTLINKEIDAVLKKYLDKFFQPAIENIRNNLGENSVTEESLRVVCRQILEDAKAQYYNSTETTRSNSQYTDAEAGSIADLRFRRTVSKSSLSALNNKRKESEADLEASQSVSKARKKAVRSVSSNVISGVPAPLKVMKVDSIKREGPKWDPSRIVRSTLFIMGARANKVLGFGQTRGRLYTKHPELLKYSGDAEDKEWLSRHNLMPPTGGIAYLLVLEDVRELAESEEYRHNPNILLNDLKGFQAPDFMLKKIRAFVSESRTDGKDQLNLTYFSDLSNDTGSRFNSAVDFPSVILTPPATVVGSAPGTPTESLDFLDCPSDLLTSAQANDYLSPSHDLIYDGLTYCDGSKSGPSLAYTSFSSSSSSSLSSTSSSLSSASSIISANNPSGLASLLLSPIESDNSQEPLE